MNTKKKKKKEKNKPRKKLIIIILCSILLLTVLGYGLYLYLKAKTPNQIIDSYTSSFNKTIDSYFSHNENPIDILNDDVKINTDLTFTTDDVRFKTLNNVKLNINASESVNKEYAEASASLSQNGKELNVNAFIDGSNAVIELKNFSNGLIGTKLDKNIFEILKEYADQNFTEEDFSYIVKKHAEFLGASLKEADIKMKENLTTVDYQVIFDKKNRELINKKFNELIKKDEKLKKFYADDIDLFSNQNIDLKKPSEFKLTINRFTKKVSKFKYKNKDKKITGKKTKNNTFEIVSSDKGKLVLTEKRNGKDFSLYDTEGKRYGSGFITWSDKKMDGTCTLDDINGKIALSFIKENKNKNKLRINYEDDYYVLNLDLESNFKNNIIENTGTLKLNQEKNNYAFDINQSISFGQDMIEKKPLPNAKDINLFSAAEQEKLIEDVKNKIKSFDFYRKVLSLKDPNTIVINTAKRDKFKNQSMIIMDKLDEKINYAVLNNKETRSKYMISDLLPGDKSYKGCIVINGDFTFTVYMYNGDYMYNGISATELTDNNLLFDTVKPKTSEDIPACKKK